MKFIIKLTLIAIALISIFYECQGDFDLGKQRLTRVYDEIVKKSKYDPESELMSLDDLNCVKNYFKLPQNANLMLKDLEMPLFLLAAYMKCANEDKMFKEYFDDMIHSGQKKRLPCLQQYLKDHEPESKLIENFEISADDLKECTENFSMEPVLKMKTSLENYLGPLEDYTCGKVTGIEPYVKLIAKGAIMKYTNVSEDVKKSEMEKIKKYFVDLTYSTVDCVVKKYETDPLAFNINDTLNYYYQKDLIPIDPDQDDPINYYKTLRKLEGVIDQDCVKKTLNLPENGALQLLEVEATFIIASAKSKCIKADPYEFSKLFIDFATVDEQNSERYYSCAKYALLKFDPSSKLAVITSADENNEKYCKHYDISPHVLRIPFSSYKDQVGRLNETTCGSLDDDVIKALSLEILLLQFEKDEELKKNEIKSLYPLVTIKLQEFADCIIERIK